MDQSLLDEGFIDSFGLVEIAAFMKGKYVFSAGESEMRKENFGSIDRMTAYLQGKSMDDYARWMIERKAHAEALEILRTIRRTWLRAAS